MLKNSDFHILIVDDEKFNIELAAVYLKEEGYKLSFALNAKGTIENLKKKDIDLILLDINMPKIDGFEVCKMIKASSKTKDIPVVFLTAQTNIEYISRAFEVGGVDYISKPFNGVELKARVKTHLQSVAYIQEIKKKQSTLAKLSITDPLTKLNNALYFDGQLKAYQTKGDPFWFIYMKLERFDTLNKVYGFDGANKIIKTFTKILKEIVPPNTIVARLYGTGFGIIIKNHEINLIKKLYEEIYVKAHKNKEAGELISFSTVMYNVKDSNYSVADLYKQVQLSMDTISEINGDKYLFVS